MTPYAMRIDALPAEDREIQQQEHKPKSAAAPFIAIAAAAVALLAIELTF